jgi:cytochrome c peroxidase
MGFDIVDIQSIFPIATGQEMLGFPDPSDHNEVGDCAPLDLNCVWGAYMARIKAIPAYQPLFAAAFPSRPWAQVGITEVGVALGSYEYAAFSFDDSPWDRFVAGDDAALSPAALRGAVTFFTPGKGNCVACHSGNAFTDLKYHKTLTPMFGPGGAVPAGDGPGGLDDYGRERISHDQADRYAWRTPPLRGVELTGRTAPRPVHHPRGPHPPLHQPRPSAARLRHHAARADGAARHPAQQHAGDPRRRRRPAAEQRQHHPGGRARPRRVPALAHRRRRPRPQPP